MSKYHAKKIPYLQTFVEASKLHEVIDRNPSRPERHILHQHVDVLGHLRRGVPRSLVHGDLSNRPEEKEKSNL